jgi:pimeloyl-ACP methyl ester carboxylesterase
MSAVTLDGEIIHYEVLGRGRPLFFLHGWVGSWRYWIPTMQAASISFRAYSIDLWGFGDTNKNSNNYPIDQQVKLLDGFMEQLGIMKVALIGHGLGAVVALSFAARYPQYVDRVMVTSFPLNLSSISPRLSSAPIPELADWLLGRQPVNEAARIEAPKADPLAIHVSLNDLQRTDLTGLTMRVSTPCLFVHGQSDPAVTMPTTETFAALPESTHYIVFEQSGHFPMLDDPSKYNRLLTDFLALASGESPRQLQLKEEWKRRVR